MRKQVIQTKFTITSSGISLTTNGSNNIWNKDNAQKLVIRKIRLCIDAFAYWEKTLFSLSKLE